MDTFAPSSRPLPWVLSRDEIVLAEIIALLGVIVWALALGWFVVADVRRSRAHRREHPRDKRKHFHLHHR